MKLSWVSAYPDNSTHWAKIKKFQLADSFADTKLSNTTFMEEAKIAVMKKWEFEYTDFSKLFSILGILDYQDSNAKIKNHHSSIQQSSSVRKVLLEPFMEEVQVEVVEKSDFQNLHRTNDSLFGIFDRSLIGRLEKNISAKVSVQRSRCCFFLKK